MNVVLRGLVKDRHGSCRPNCHRQTVKMFSGRYHFATFELTYLLLRLARATLAIDLVPRRFRDPPGLVARLKSRSASSISLCIAIRASAASPATMASNTF